MISLSSTKLIHLTANVATFFFVVTIMIQIFLAAGVLPISLAWGGQAPQLTPTLQIASVISAMILGVFIYVIRSRAGLVGHGSVSAAVKLGAWIITVFMALNTLGNVTSSNSIEKFAFAAVTFTLSVACLLISVSKSNSTIRSKVVL